MSTPEVTLPAWAPSTRTVAESFMSRLLKRGGAVIDSLREQGDFGTDTWPSRATAVTVIGSVLAEVRATVGRIALPAQEPDAVAAPMLWTLWEAMRSAVVTGACADLTLILAHEVGGRPDLSLHQALREDFERKLKTLGTLAELTYDDGGSDGDPSTDDPDGSGSGARWVELRDEPFTSDLVDGAVRPRTYRYGAPSYSSYRELA